MVVANRDRPLFLLRNVVPKKGHWLGLHVLNRRGHVAIGADLQIEAGGRAWWRSVSPHESYASSNDPRVHCGLGAAGQVQHVMIRWPGGREESFGPFAADRYVEIREGSGSVVTPSGPR